MKAIVSLYLQMEKDIISKLFLQMQLGPSRHFMWFSLSYLFLKFWTLDYTYDAYVITGWLQLDMSSKSSSTLLPKFSQNVLGKTITSSLLYEYIWSIFLFQFNLCLSNNSLIFDLTRIYQLCTFSESIFVLKQFENWIID